MKKAMAALILFLMETLLFYLYEMPLEAWAYSSVFILLIFGGWIILDEVQQRKKYKQLKNIQKEAEVYLETEHFGKPENAVEKEYQNLAEMLGRQWENARQEARCQISEANRYYIRWSHQIKTPIFALRLLLREEPEENRESGAQLFRIEQYVEMALQYQRLDSETTDFVFEETDLDEIIRTSVRKYARQFIAKKISLSYEPVETTVITDKKWLSFVIEQVISNAVKYTKTGGIKIYLEDGDGTMSVPVQKASHRKEDDGENSGMKSVRLVIEDTGIGIRAEDLPRICEMGYTGCNGHEGQHSSGIGLYLCSRILKKLGHTFSITSKEEVGTVVKIG